MHLAKNSPLIILIIIWTLVHASLITRFGIITHGEPEKYIREANNLITQGALSSPNFWLYITEISLIFISIKFGLGNEAIVALQIAFSLIATLSVYRLGTFLFTRTAGLFAGVLFLLNLPMHQFNNYLQTDSLFFSFTVIYTCWLLQTKELSFKIVVTAFVALFLISVTRPTGLFYFPATFLYFYFRFFKQFKLPYKILVLVLVSGIFLGLLNTAIGSGGELDFMLPARDERIICGVPTLPHFIKIDEVKNGNSLYGLFYYITHNFPQFSRLAFQRTIAFFGLTRSYYGYTHNIYLILFFFPVYIMDILSMKYWIRKEPYVFLFLLSLIFFTWLTVILSCDDWHNRFFLTISPYLFVLAIPAINRLFLNKI